MTQAAWILRVRSGKRAHAHAVLAPGGTLRVGRDVPADLVIPDDRSLALVHFTLQHQGEECLLTDTGAPGGTSLNGRPALAAATTAALHGAWLRAGNTDFSLYREAHTPPLDDPDQTESKSAVLAALRNAGEPLFGVFDAARDMRVLELLRESVEEVVSLYDGQAGEAMAEAAPYLVSFPQSLPSPPGSSLLERLVHEGWGQSWGVWLTSSRPMVEVRRQLRRHLVVRNDQTEERLYFRFYDPRVLRVFLPTCLPKQRSEMFGELSRFLLEGEAGELVVFEKGAARAGA